ncbi:MAG: hypothetical protein ACKO29_01110, partial [Actinomycetota bacterium]
MAERSKGYRRVLLKLSGEVFGGEKGIGVDPDVVADVAEQIADVVKSGVEIAIVVGGGNYFHTALLQLGATEIISATNNDCDLNAAFYDICDLLCHISDDIGIDAD